MDACAELTLRLVRAGQEALNPLSSMVDWVFFPDHQHATWSQAREILTGAVKPLLVAPLLESGSVAIWSVGEFQPQHRAVAEREFANQCQYFDQKLAGLALGDTDQIETPDGTFTLTVAELRQWATEYAVAVGIGMTASPVAGRGRILIRPPGGGRPVGSIER
ncbi:MAG TPA: hypothetical protein VGN73_00265, partial [Gemmatimonadaceae bacterium]|nr:hypothetical protein [Gemmatimonadaceae bacterium]